MRCPHCHGRGRVTSWRPTAIYEHGYDGNPEQGSWSERHCAHCEGTGHAADDRPGAATLCCFGALLLALVYWWTR
ncbi:MAG: hypothetical protein JNL96_05080 [Planctomycetaceae bacterium]|nr:hypothetical protein [Planctomycetaceae bacterium]